MKKIANIYLQLLTICLLVLVLASCEEKEFNAASNVVEGEHITVSLDLSAAQEKDIVMTRVDNSLSGLRNLVIFVYSGDNFRQIVSTADNTLTCTRSNTSNDGVYYTVNFNTTSGRKNLLAVANASTGATSSGYWKSIQDIAQKAQNGELTFDQLQSSIIGLHSQDGMQPIEIASSDQMLMTGWNEGVVFDTKGNVTDYGTNADEKDVILRLDRSMARITFNIPYKEYNESANENKIFTPTSYRVYNVPVNSYLANAENKSIEANSENFISYAETNINRLENGDYSFTFFMPENVYGNINTTVTDYHARDEWKSSGHEGASPEEKTTNNLWSNAPQYSTFVVIKGTYEQTSVDKDYTGTVEYTIHLGDFSETTGAWGNYSIERNCSYTYKVNVLDVERIIVEAKKEDGTYQEGSEGAIYDYTQSDYAYHLDAHYEQVYLEYNLSDIAQAAQDAVKLATENGETLTIDDAIANALVLVIQSEAMDQEENEQYYSVHNKRGTLKPYQVYTEEGETGKSTVLNGHFDYKWVEFWPQLKGDYNDELAKYPGVPDWSKDAMDGFKNTNVYGGTAYGNTERLMDVYDIIVEMGKAVRQICDGKEPDALKEYDYNHTDGEIIVSNSGANRNPEYVACFTAFVNEYYYYRHPLTEAKISSWSLFTNKIPREMIVATSTSISEDGNSSYSVLYSYISQLSMQTFYNSRILNGLNGFGIETYNETPLYEFGKTNYNGSKTDGRANQLDLLSVEGNNNMKNPEWDTYVNYAYNGWFRPVTSERGTHKLTDNAYPYSHRDAYSACMSRNRDLNGNGRIDNNEVRWYLASVNEYIRMSIGADAISRAAQLYTNDKSLMRKNNYPDNYVEDGALYYTSSADNQRIYWAVERGSYGNDNDWAAPNHYKPIRCIRLLPGTDNTHDISTVDGINADPTYEYDAQKRIFTFTGRLVDGLYRQQVITLDPHTEDDAANRFYNQIVVAKERASGKFPLGQIIQAEGYSNENPCANYHEEGDGGATWRVPNLVEFSAMNAVEGLLQNDDACGTQFSNQNVRYGFKIATDNGRYIMATGGDSNQTLSSQYTVRCVRDLPE